MTEETDKKPETSEDKPEQSGQPETPTRPAKDPDWPFEDDEDFPALSVGVYGATITAVIALIFAVFSPWWGEVFKDALNHPTTAEMVRYGISANNERLDLENMARQQADLRRDFDAHKRTYDQHISSRHQNHTRDISDLRRRLSNLEARRSGHDDEVDYHDPYDDPYLDPHSATGAFPERTLFNEIDRLQNRLDELEWQFGSLNHAPISALLPETMPEQVALTAEEIARLRQALQTGEPVFGDVISTLADQQRLPADLADFQDQPVFTPAELATQFEAQLAELIAQERAAKQSGLRRRATLGFNRLISIRRSPDSVEEGTALSRMRIFLQEGDLSEAQAESFFLSAESQTLLADWLRDLDRHLRAEALVRDLSPAEAQRESLYE